MTVQRTKRFILPMILGSMGFLTILVSEVIVQIQGSKIVQVTWLASFLIMVSTIIIRFYSIDPKHFDEIIQTTNPMESQHLKSLRFLNWIVLAMVIGLIATITIAFDFFVGVLIYLVMQVCLIVSFSGIISLRPSVLLANPKLRKSFITSLVFWMVAAPLIYFVLIYSNAESLLVIPYVIAIGTMACISCFGLGYDQRSKAFRWMMIAASLLFVFSDTLIGNARYGQVSFKLNQLIDITYVLNILLMSHAILFLKDGSGNTPFKT
ncbi:MAG: lysoplasmalogenase family protein [Promethearchaeota archaeon]